MTRQIHVAAGIILKDNRFLATRRQKGTHLAGYWEFPGGKLDQGETEAEALVREIREELGVEAMVEEPIFHRKSFTYPGRQVHLSFYLCTLTENKPEPKALVADELVWFTAEEIDPNGFPPANKEVLALLKEKLENQA